MIINHYPDYDLFKNEIKFILQLSKNNNIGHIPSAISSLPLWSKLISKKNIFIGKHFGIQAMFASIYKNKETINFLTKELEKLNISLNSLLVQDSPEYNFLSKYYDIKYIDSTLGMALSVAIGYWRNSKNQEEINIIIPDSYFSIGEFYENMFYMYQYQDCFNTKFKIHIDFNNQAINEYRYPLNKSFFNILEEIPVEVHVYHTNKKVIPELNHYSKL